MIETHITYFNQIKAKVEKGADINLLENSVSMLNKYLDYYYRSVYDINLNDYQVIDEDDQPFPLELTLELCQRDPRLLEHLNWFIDNGADINAGQDDFPLMRAVGNADAAMVDFLIIHGADPFYDGEDEVGIPFGGGNWYIDDFDIQVLNASFDSPTDVALFDAILNTVVTLAKHGVTSSGIHCITINPQKRSVELRKAQVKY